MAEKNTESFPSVDTENSVDTTLSPEDQQRQDEQFASTRSEQVKATEIVSEQQKKQEAPQLQQTELNLYLEQNEQEIYLRTFDQMTQNLVSPNKEIFSKIESKLSPADKILFTKEILDLVKVVIKILSTEMGLDSSTVTEQD